MRLCSAVNGNGCSCHVGQLLQTMKILITFTTSDGLSNSAQRRRTRRSPISRLFEVFFLFTIGVFTVPGAIAFTVMPYFAHSNRKHPSKLTNGRALEAEYAPLSILGLNAETEDNKMILETSSEMAVFKRGKFPSLTTTNLLR